MRRDEAAHAKRVCQMAQAGDPAGRPYNASHQARFRKHIAATVGVAQGRAGPAFPLWLWGDRGGLQGQRFGSNRRKPATTMPTPMTSIKAQSAKKALAPRLSKAQPKSDPVSTSAMDGMVT